jgi:hypothetical protein
VWIGRWLTIKGAGQTATLRAVLVLFSAGQTAKALRAIDHGVYLTSFLLV